MNKIPNPNFKFKFAKASGEGKTGCVSRLYIYIYIYMRLCLSLRSIMTFIITSINNLIKFSNTPCDLMFFELS